MEILGIVIGLLMGLVVGGIACWFIRGARARSELANQQVEIAVLHNQLEQATTSQQLLETAGNQLSERFKATAAEVLQSNSRQFMELSEQNLGKTMEQAKGELEQRHRQFQELVKPLSENYGKLNPLIESLDQRSQSLAAETGKLSSALTDIKQVGNWGEIQLRRVVELANMTSYSDFGEQETTGESRDRPDLIVRLPEGRAIVIDAKASIAAALEAQNAEDEASADAAWKKHANALKTQVNSLSRKHYGDAIDGSLDFVVMFVPGDQFLAAALKADPGLVDYAMSKQIAIATPATLIALLWTVNSGWQKWELAQNAAEISKLGSEMHERLLDFLKDYGSVRNRLSQTVKAFNDSARTLENQVLVPARQIAEMRAIDVSAIKEPALVKSSPRQISAAIDSDETSDNIAADDN